MSTSKYTGYFPHDSNAKDDPKIMIMMVQLGLEAYGIYWLLIEFLREQQGYQAPLLLLDPLARRYGSSKEKFEAVVTKFNLFEYDDVNFYSPSLNRRMLPVDEKRVKMRELINKRWHKNTENKIDNTHVLLPYYVGNTEKSRVEYSKEEKSRIKKGISFSFISPDFLPVWEKWLAYRKLIKKPYRTENGMVKKYNELINLSSDDPEHALLIVQQSIDEEWAGLFPLKTKTKPGKGVIPGEDPVDKIIREANEFMKNKKSTTTDDL